MSLADSDIPASAVRAVPLFPLSGELALTPQPLPQLFDLILSGLSKMTEAEKKGEIKKVNGIFEMRVKNGKGKEGIWTIDLKKVRADR